MVTGTRRRPAGDRFRNEPVHVRVGACFLLVYRPADARWAAGVNRINGRRLGWYVQTGRWCLSIGRHL